MDKGAKLTGAAGSYAPPLFLPRPGSQFGARIRPRGLVQGPILPVKVGHLSALPRRFYEYPEIFCPVLHHHFLVPIGALVIKFSPPCRKMAFPPINCTKETNEGKVLCSEWTRFAGLGLNPFFFPLGRVGFYFLNTRVPGFRILGLTCLKIRVLGNIFD